LALVCAACGAKRPRPYPVQGKVLVDGRPARHAVLTFHPVNGKPDAPRPVGHADEEGRFRLTTYKQGDGAPAGEYQVTVTWFLAGPSSGLSEGEESAPVNHLPSRYASAGTSELQASVRKGPNELPTFELQSR
jgi:hypothetical protein